MTEDRLTDLVWTRLCEVYPRAFLIGKEPPLEFGFLYVDQAPFDAVVLGILSPGQLLQMPSDPVCSFLLNGKPVYYWPEQTFRHASHGKLLQRKLDQAEQMLRQLGVRFLTEPGPLLTMEAISQIMERGEPIPVGCRLTNGAKEIWERTHNDRRNRDGKFVGDQKM